MGEEDHAHVEGLKHTDERARLEGVYGAYAADPRKQRSWSAQNPGNAAMRAEVLDALAPWVPPAGAILDAGCGTGWLLAHLARTGVDPARLYGVDLLEERAASAAAAVAGARVEAADLRRLPFDDGSFALVVLLTVLSSLAGAAEVGEALAETRRVLAPGGAVAVWEPRLPNPLNRATRVIRRSELEAAMGPAAASRTLTLLPPLARRLGAGAYPRLARIPVLRSHRFTVLRP